MGLLMENNSETKAREKNVSLRLRPLKRRSSDLCLCLSIILRAPDCSMPGMPDKGGNGTGSIVSSVYEKRSNLIKITLAAVEKIPVSSPWDASVYVTHFPSCPGYSGLLASASFTSRTFPCKSPCTFLNETGFRLRNCQPEWLIFHLQHLNRSAV